MQEFYTQINKQLYYLTVLSVIVMMIMGLLIGNPRSGELEVGYLIHTFLVGILSLCLLLYPKFATHTF